MELSKISTMQDLLEAKQQIKNESEFILDKLAETSSDTGRAVQNLFVRKMMVPFGLAGLAIMSIKKLSENNLKGKDEVFEMGKTNKLSKAISMLLPLAINYLKSEQKITL